MASRTALHCGAEERSEEHTSELQSRSDLVCRLLLEKKNRSHTPPASRVRFATSPAILASVLVSAMPTDTGMPVHRFTVARIARPYSVRLRPVNPDSLRKASSIE